MEPFGHGQVEGLGPADFDIGAGGVKVGVVGYNLIVSPDNVKQNFFRRASLVGGNDMAKSGQILNRFFQTIKALGSGIGFIAFNHAAPLAGAHGRSAAVSQQINEHVIRMNIEKIIAGFL